MKNKKRFLRIVSFLLSSVMCIGAFLIIPNNTSNVLASTIDEDKIAIAQKEDELEQLKKKRQNAQKELDALKGQQAEHLKRKSAMDAQIISLTKELEMLNSLIEDYNKQIVATEEEIAIKQEQVDKSYEQFKLRIRTSYEEGLVSYAELMFSADSFSDFLSRIEIVGSLLDYDKAVIKRLDAQCRELQASKDELSALKKSAEEKLAESKKQKEELNRAQDELEVYLNAIQSDVSRQAQLLKEAQAAENEINAVIEKMLKDLAAKENAAYVGGEFNWPVPIEYKRISSKFGWRKLNGVDDYHGGMDIPCPTGTNVMASNAGKVVVAEYHYSYGNYVLINHGGGYSTLYAHNSKLLVSVGDVVSQGDVIALAGNTGNSYGSHCHFEVRIDGVRKDPMGFVTPPNGWYYS